MSDKFKKSVCLILSFLLPLAVAGVLAAQQNSFNKSSKSRNSRANESIRNSAASNQFNQEGLKQVQTRDFVSAETSFRLALENNPLNVTAAYNLASTYIINKKADDAVALLNEYAVRAPSDIGLLIRLGDAYLSKKDSAHAARVYQHAFDLDKDYPEILTKLASVSLINEKPLEAEKYLEEQIIRYPQDASSVAKLSSIYLANGKADKAIAAAKKALQFKAEKQVYITLASAYEMKSDYKNALIAFERAADLGGDSPEISKKIQGLRKAVS